jgi:Carboxypeptidase regulatory-like domain
VIALTGEGLPTYNITGRVITDDGLSLKGVKVSLSGSRNASTTTGTDGSYSFNGLDAGGKLDVPSAEEKQISEVHIFSTQDNLAAAAEQFDETLPFTEHGLQDFDVEYWTNDGWKPVPGGAVTVNERVWLKIAFPPLRTAKIRLVVKGVLDTLPPSPQTRPGPRA